MANTDSISIRRNCKRMLLSFCLTLLLGGYGSYELATIQIAYAPLRAIAQSLIALFAVVMFLLYVQILRRLLSREPALVLNHIGVTVYPQHHQEGPIHWSDVENVAVVTDRGTPFVQLNVRNPEKYLTHGNPLERFFNRLNYRWYGSPVYLTNTGLEISFDELAALVHRFFAESRLPRT